MSKLFLKSFRITKRSEYKKIFLEKNRLVGNFILINYRYGKSDFPKLGITASKKYGKAYLRNRFKRIVRDAFRKNLSNLPPNIELNICPRKDAPLAKSMDIENELLFLLKASTK